ncbi:MAG: FtsX-like permease family protein [Lachnospiraceae bacterium]|nr:FtsX-like permease family protein [Lachnospiraceae bacterium]
MLKKLSKRNAKRQMVDYIIYIITLIVTVALLLSFNMIMFSSEIAVLLKEKSILPLIIVMVSILVVLIMSMLVNHITMFILKRRSKEFGLYMLLGIENRKIANLFVMENRSIHSIVLIIGLIIGTVLYHAIKAIICHIYAVPVQLSVDFSVKATILTLLYMSAIVFFTEVRTKRAFGKLTVKELLYLDNADIDETEKNKKGTVMRAVSAIAGVIGFAILLLSIFQSRSENEGLLAIVLIAISVYGLFTYLYRHFLSRLKNIKWKYAGKRLFIYRQLTAKMRSMLHLMAGVCILMTVALLIIDWGIFFAGKVDDRVNAVAFDVGIFSDDKNADFSQQLSYLRKTDKLNYSYEYRLFSDGNDTYFQQSQKAVRGKLGYSLSGADIDIFMSVSDYMNLREMLGLPKIAVDQQSYILHCSPAYITSLQAYVNENPVLLVGGISYRFGGIYSEDFLQQELPGNGNGVLIIVPDKAVSALDIQKQVLAITTRSDLSLAEINELSEINNNVDIVSKIGVRNQSAPMAVYMVLPAFYLAFVLCAVACTILSVQILSYAKKERRSYLTLNYLGVGVSQQKKLLKKHLLQLYFLPAIPAAFINILSFPMMTGSIAKNANGTLQIISLFSRIKQSFITVSLFLIFLMLYYVGTLIIYEHSIMNGQ